MRVVDRKTTNSTINFIEIPQFTIETLNDMIGAVIDA